MIVEPVSLAIAASAEGQKRFPGVEVDLGRFGAFLARGGRAERREAWAELFLAFACAEHDPVALGHFERCCLAGVPAALAPLTRDRALSEDVIQQLRFRFFVTPPPRILEVLGRGSLEGWVRAAAVRLALDVLRSRSASDERALEDALFREAAEPAELTLMVDRHGPDFRRAFLRAFRGLSARELAVLKLHLVDRASIDQIGEIYGIHRATAARWVSRVREVLRERTLAAFQQVGSVAESQLSSLVRVLVKDQDFSLERRLRG